MNHFIYATTNPGKRAEVKRFLGGRGVEVCFVPDFGIKDFDVPETGTTLGENAVIKVSAYLGALQDKQDLRGHKFVVVADDTGLEIDSLNGAPGIHVRRWKGYRMTDGEIINHALSEMRHIKQPDRTAQFRTVLAAGVLHSDGVLGIGLKQFEGTLLGEILEEPRGKLVDGSPFAQLFYVPEWKMRLGAMHELPQEEKDKYMDHREQAIHSTVPFIMEQLGL